MLQPNDLIDSDWNIIYASDMSVMYIAYVRVIWMPIRTCTPANAHIHTRALSDSETIIQLNALMMNYARATAWHSAKRAYRELNELFAWTHERNQDIVTHGGGGI